MGEETVLQGMEQEVGGETAVYPGAAGVIDEKWVEDALMTLKKYKDAKSDLTARVVNAEEWWKQHHWERFGSESANENDPKPVSAWLFNSLINKHADFMDNYPCPAILPREKSDEEIAKTLSSVVPAILEQNNFESVYTQCSWEKPKSGTAVYGVFWNQDKENGLGDIEITCVDIINLFWEPGISDIQKSKKLFTVEIVDRDSLIEMYPFAEGKTGTAEEYKPEYVYAKDLDTAEKTAVFDCYYKKKVYSEIEGIRVCKTVLHYCKFIPGLVLYATENDEERMERGWYDHGQYPFVFDTMFPDKGTPAGFGYLDVMVNPQEYIDKLDSVILKHAQLNRPRYFVSASAGVNEQEFSDMSKDFVHTSGNVDDTNVKPIDVPQLSAHVITTRQNKIDELKETSGNRDFSQGSTTSGVTAASAIAALQEAGSKLSRDMIKTSYKKYAEVVTLAIELIRQFYDLPRCYRITQPNGMDEYVSITNEQLQPSMAPMMDGGIASRKPVFDIKISAQKASPYSRIATNELAKELYGMGVFNPQLADQAMAVVTMMDFDRKDEVLKKIQENGLMYQELQRMQQVMQQMAAVIAETTGNTKLLDVLGMNVAGSIGATDVQVDAREVKTDSLGGAVGGSNGGSGQERKARERAATATEVKA